MTVKLEFFWDAVSPYTYLASTQITQLVEELAEEVSIELVWRPFFLGGVMQATGNKPPATVAAKGRHLFADLRRWAAMYDVPFWFPKSFPANTVAAMRMACYAQKQGKQAELAMALMQAHWGNASEGADADIANADVLQRLAEQVGLDGAEALAATQDQKIKDELKANTEEAVTRGAFGAPTFFVEDEMFWGNDRLPLLKQHLLQAR